MTAIHTVDVIEFLARLRAHGVRSYNGDSPGGMIVVAFEPEVKVVYTQPAPAKPEANDYE